jgi:hypothetical protein
MSQAEKEETLKIAFELLDYRTTWKIKRIKDNISTTVKSYGLVYRVHIDCMCPADVFFEKLLHMKSPMVLESVHLGMVDEHTDIIRVKTEPSPCNFVKSKEIVNLRTWIQNDNSYLIVARSLNSQNAEYKNEIMVWQINYETQQTCTVNFMMSLTHTAPINIAYIFFKKYIKTIKLLSF